MYLLHCNSTFLLLQISDGNNVGALGTDLLLLSSPSPVTMFATRSRLRLVCFMPAGLFCIYIVAHPSTQLIT